MIRVPYAMTVHGQDEIDAVVEVLKTSTQMGPKTREFEEKISKKFNKKHGVMVNSGTSALFLAMEALNIPKGSEVITPALTFATTVGCIVKNGLVPAFVDIKKDTYCIDETKIEEMITQKTKAMVIPNLMANIPNWEILRTIADKYDLKILEDSADIIGAKYKDKLLGDYSDITISSFYGMHVINCAGNGGIACTNNQEYVDKMKILRSWGRSSSLFDEKSGEAIENRFDVSVDGVPYDAKFVFEDVGYNLEGAELGAAFGLVQLNKLDAIIEKRKAVASSHMNFLRKYEKWIQLPLQNKDASTIWFAFPMIIKEEAPFTRRDIQIFLEKRNIQTRVVFTGNITRQPGFKNIKCKKSPNGYPESDIVMERGFLFASHHGLTEEMMDHLYNSLEEFFSQYK